MRRLIALLALALPAAAGAHEIWVERDGAGPARIYLGEPDQPPLPGGDPEFAKLTAPRILSAPAARFDRRAGYLEARVPAGDVRVWDDAVFQPWGEPGAREGVVYYARAGRQETAAKLPFEIAPVVPGGTRFAVTRDGRPVADTEVALIGPDRAKRTLRTDAAGRLDTGALRPGRHLLVAALKEGPATLPGGPVQTVHRITTTTFTAR